MIRNKKGSVFFIIFFVAIVMVIFYMIGLQNRAPALGIKIATQTERTYNYAEQLKRFTIQVASESLTKASYEEAATFPSHNVIEDNQPEPYNLTHININIAERARQMVNEYLAFVKGTEFDTVLFKETTLIENASVPVTGLDLMSGTVYDNFPGIFLGTAQNRITNLNTNEESSFIHQYHAYTQCDRYYYMIDMINRWAIANKLSADICNAIPIVNVSGKGTLYYPSIDEDTVRIIAKGAFDDLMSRFDSNVSCEYSLTDLIAKTDLHVSDSPEPCIEGDGVNLCGGGCPGGKNYVTSYTNCIGESLGSKVPYGGGEWHPNGATYTLNCGGLGQTHTVIFTMNITCTDYKCANPIGPSGWEYLTMSFNAKIHQIHHTDPPKKECSAPSECASSNPTSGSTPSPDHSPSKNPPSSGGAVPGIP